mmetsp:Transcript_60506/g.139574  ORF Transcript_60506/g.139574 Transcript_60506/m.139574 type:complete len:823 (-) Transcript_60506:94-2562(-)
MRFFFGYVASVETLVGARHSLLRYQRCGVQHIPAVLKVCVAAVVINPDAETLEDVLEPFKRASRCFGDDIATRSLLWLELVLAESEYYWAGARGLRKLNRDGRREVLEIKPAPPFKSRHRHELSVARLLAASVVPPPRLDDCARWRLMPGRLRPQAIVGWAYEGEWCKYVEQLRDRIVQERFDDNAGWFSRPQQLHDRVCNYGALSPDTLALFDDAFIPPNSHPAGNRLRAVVRSLDKLIATRTELHDEKLVVACHCVTLLARFLTAYIREVRRQVEDPDSDYAALLQSVVASGLRSYADIFGVVASTLIEPHPDFQQFKDLIHDELIPAIPDWAADVLNCPEPLGLVCEAASAVVLLQKVVQDVAHAVGGTEMNPPIKSLWRVCEKIFIDPEHDEMLASPWVSQNLAKFSCADWPWSDRNSAPSCTVEACASDADRHYGTEVREAAHQMSASRIRDAARCAICCGDDMGHKGVSAMTKLRMAAEELSRHPGVVVSRVKERFSSPSPGGWRDVLVNVVIVPTREEEAEAQLPRFLHAGRRVFARWSDKPTASCPAPSVGVPLTCLCHHGLLRCEPADDVTCAGCNVVLGSLGYRCSSRPAEPEVGGLESAIKISMLPVGVALGGAQTVAHGLGLSLGAKRKSKPDMLQHRQSSGTRRSIDFAKGRHTATFGTFDRHFVQDLRRGFAHAPRSVGCDQDLVWCESCFRAAQKSTLAIVQQDSQVGSSVLLSFPYAKGHVDPQYVPVEQIVGVAHVGEVQLVHGKLFMLRSSEHFKGHDAYASSRAAQELLEMFGIPVQPLRSMTTTRSFGGDSEFLSSSRLANS